MAKIWRVNCQNLKRWVPFVGEIFFLQAVGAQAIPFSVNISSSFLETQLKI
jgi:hypothetical protein